MTLAVASWAEAIGAEHVLCDNAVLAEWQTATFATSQQVLAVLRPASAEQVAACMEIADCHRVPVYPVSRGRNWGLGSRVPASDAVILDLARLDRVLAWDERYGSITLEPGVTFRQVHAFLAERNSDWFLPVIGGPAEASVIGNCVERGDGVGPNCERLSSMCSLEIVLPGGKMLRTGYERFGETPLASLSSMPAGPYLDGLFTQSNFGIVTRATLWLARHPKHLQLIAARIREGALAIFVDSLQQLVDRLGHASCTFSLWNGHKLNARHGAAGDHSPGDWFSNGCLYAPSALMAAAQRELAVHALEGCSRLEVFDEVAVPDLREQAGLFLGVPTNENIRSLYAAKTGPVPEGDLDPDRDRCGAIWLCPEVPFDGAAVVTAIGICETMLGEFGYPPVIGMSGGTPRTIRIFVSVFYDRETPGEDERAMRCHDQLHKALCTAGFFPFRLGIHSMYAASQATGPCWDLVRRIKDSLDPAGILAPGRYCSMADGDSG
ncbi:MAG: FAD-binding oxidoreductase [Acidobacteriota bacterium]